MSDQDVADVVDYVRNAWSNVRLPYRKTAWSARFARIPRPCFRARGETKKIRVIPDRTLPRSNRSSIPQHQIDQTLRSMTGETMLTTIDQSIARARQVAPDASRSDIVNDLTLAYCEVEAAQRGLSDADKRRLLTRFSELVYTQLASNGKD